MEPPGRVAPASRIVSHYEILEKLGEGGMGVVYKARDSRLDRLVALKFLAARRLDSPRAAALFLEEARAISALNHPHIATLHDVGEDQGRKFLVLEYLPGGTLKSKIRELRRVRQRLSVAEVLEYAVQIAEGLAHAHRHGVIHRDVKTSNVLFTAEGELKLVDFGLARSRTQGSGVLAGTIAGTLDYMAPEQLQGLETDARSDIFSFGVVLYEMASAELPFKGSSETALVLEILEAPIPKLGELRGDLPEAFERIVRRALEKEPSNRYQEMDELLAELRRLRAESASEASDQSTQTAIALVTPRRRFTTRRKLVVGTAALAGLLGLFTVRWLRLPPAPGVLRLAVLPFADLSPQKDQEYFCDGIAEELIQALGRIETLRVVARTSAFRFKGRALDLDDIGRQLKADAVLEGSVRKDSSRLRISARLVRVRDGYQLWTGSYERDLQGVFVIQEEIAQAIVGALNVGLAAQADRGIVKRPTHQLEAHNLYLRGAYFCARRTREGLEKGKVLFEQAVATDPGYALAYAGLADSFNLLGEYNALPARQAYPQALVAARRALRLDETLPEAHAALAFALYHYEWDWPQAEREFRRALALNPRCVAAQHWYAVYLAARGDFDAALEHLRQAQDLDPLSLIVHSATALVHYFAGRHDQAIEQCRRTLEMDPNYAPARHVLASAYLQKGLHTEGVAEYVKVLAASGEPPETGAALQRAYAMGGTAGFWLKDIELSQRRDGWNSPLGIAAGYAASGHKDLAFQWLDKAYAVRSSRLVNLKVEPMFATLRSDPRFQSLVRKIGL